jgi:hypothetical protein
MAFHPGILLQKFRRLHPKASFQTQDIIRGKDDGGFAAALGKARHARVTLEFETALGGQLPGFHHPHIHIYHVPLLRFFFAYEYLIKILPK